MSTLEMVAYNQHHREDSFIIIAIVTNAPQGLTQLEEDSYSDCSASPLRAARASELLSRLL